MDWFESLNFCKLSSRKFFQELNVGNVWLGGLFLQTPWMVHRGMLGTSSYSQKFKNVTLLYKYNYHIKDRIKQISIEKIRIYQGL